MFELFSLSQIGADIKMSFLKYYFCSPYGALCRGVFSGVPGVPLELQDFDRGADYNTAFSDLPTALHRMRKLGIQP